MDTNLFSLFGAEGSDDNNAPKKQTAKKKSAKSKQQTAVDLFSFDTEESESVEQDTKNDEVQIAIEDTPIPASIETANTNDISEYQTATKEIENQSIVNTIDDAPKEAVNPTENISDVREEIAEEVVEVVEEVVVAEEVVEEVIQEEEISEVTNIEALQELPTEALEVITANTVSAFQIEPIQEEEAIAQTMPEPTLEEFLSSMETSTNDDDILEKQYLQEVIVSDYSMFIDSSSATKQTAENPSITEVTINEFEKSEEKSLPEWTLTKKYYSIGEVATLFDVNTSHIRFWSKEFNFRLRTTRKGDRMYTPEDIQKLRLIHELVKVKKHTIKGAKEILNTKTQKVSQTVDLKDNLKELKNMLLGIQNKL